IRSPLPTRRSGHESFHHGGGIRRAAPTPHDARPKAHGPHGNRPHHGTHGPPPPPPRVHRPSGAALLPSRDHHRLLRRRQPLRRHARVRHPDGRSRDGRCGQIRTRQPGWGEVFSDTVNTGIYLLEPSVFDAIPPHREYDFGKDLFPALLAEGRPLYGHVAEGYWRDVGDLTGYRLGPPGPPPGKHRGRGATIGAKAFLAEGVVVGDFSKIGESSTLKANVKVWPYKEVEDGATLAVSLVWGERWSRALFGRYGVTGLANIEVSPEFASKLGAPLGASLGKRRAVTTSRDHHKTSRMINRALMAGALSVGVDVQDLGVAPIPVVRYQIPALGLAGGSHVRKSPYDRELLDIKFFDARGLDLAPERERAVERLFFREDFYRAPTEETGVLSFPHAGTDRYRDGMLRTVDREVVRKAQLRLVLDYAFGPASAIFPAILGELGVEVISLNAYLDETRIAKTTEEFRRSLDQLSNIVRTLGADLGVLLDTGGEKVFLVDEKGEVVPGELALALMALLAMRTHPPGTVVVPITASQVVDRLAAEHGFRLIRARGNPRSLAEAALSPGVVLVGEERGGFIFPAFQPAFDAMAAVVKLLEMMARLGGRLNALIRQVPESHVTRGEVPCPNEEKGAVMRRLLAATKGQAVDLVEGVRVRMGEEWVAAIPDPDRACFLVVGESPDRDRARALVEELKERIAGWGGGGGGGGRQSRRGGERDWIACSSPGASPRAGSR